MTVTIRLKRLDGKTDVLEGIDREQDVSRQVVRLGKLEAHILTVRPEGETPRRYLWFQDNFGHRLHLVSGGELEWEGE